MSPAAAAAAALPVGALAAILGGGALLALLLLLLLRYRRASLQLAKMEMELASHRARSTKLAASDDADHAASAGRSTATRAHGGDARGEGEASGEGPMSPAHKLVVTGIIKHGAESHRKDVEMASVEAMDMES